MNPGLLRKAPAAKGKAQKWRNNVLDRTSIPRKSGPADEYSFDGLRSEGIKLVQDLSGSIWTDYNLHDPGVTILEQLCYALTDLINRAESDIPDYLTGSNRQINFEQQALFKPRTIFPSGPVTINDYRKIIFDGVPELDNVWITKVDDESGQGLYHVYAQMQTPDELSETQLEQAKTDVIDQITKIYSAHRNLCEDLKDVTVVEHVHYSLHGEVEIGGDREPPDILSEIYFKTSQFMASSIPFHSYEEVLSGGENLEEVFSGPFTPHVYIQDEHLDQERETVTDSDLVEVIKGIEGVVRIGELSFQGDSGQPVNSVPFNPFSGHVPHIQFPSRDEDIGLVLHRNARTFQIRSREVKWGFDRRNAEYLSRRRTIQDVADLYTLPRGQLRDFRAYYSIQHQFPDVYGINDYGLPASASPERKTQAANLKAYLLFFEQVMGNFQELLQNTSTLFSLDEDLKQTYFYQILKDPQVPHADDLYVAGADVAAAQISQLLKRYDRFADRRNRVLDYLLGLFGEQFTPDPFLHLGFYSEDGPALEAIRVKLNLLRSIGHLI